MTNEFDVIGERKDDDLHLLVRDDDGRHYDYSVANEQVSPVDLDERWKIDRESPVEDGALEAPESGDPQPQLDSEMPSG